MRKIFEPDSLCFVPLGGSEQFGANLNVYACNGELLAVDCGIGFADERYPGIDLLLPDPWLLEEHKDKLKGLIITHAHEDHIGALAYLWDRLECPVYASRFTAAVLRKKLTQEGIEGVPIHVIEPEDSVNIGSAFSVRFVAMSHSVPQSSSLLIETPYGRVFHTGDWNLDPHCPASESFSEEKVLRSIGDEGVLAYVGDSTNAEYDGYAGSELDVSKGLIEEFKLCNGKIAITIFSSNIDRVISIARAAQEVGRSVGVIGRSLHRMIGCAYECGMLDGLPDFLSENEIADLPSDKLVLIVTGSQGEFRAALSKIARGEFRSFSLNRGDTVIFSARAIPGNERTISVVKNNLSATGVHIVTPKDTKNIIHVSGHPYKEEIRKMYEWIKPQCVVPVHGEHIQLSAQADLARSCGIDKVVQPVNGSVIRLAPGEPDIINHVETAFLAIDKSRIISARDPSITARRKLQYSGTVHASVVVDQDFNLLGHIKISTVGLEEENIIEDLEDLACEKIEMLDYNMSEDALAEQLRILFRKHVSMTLGLRPKTTVHVTRIDV